MSDTIKPLDEDTVKRRLAAELPAWALQDGALVRFYRTANWKGTMLAANAVAHLCEVAWHHPTLVLDWGKVEVRLSTHQPRGITERDFALAARIEALMAWRPGREGGALEGTPDDPKNAYLKEG